MDFTAGYGATINGKHTYRDLQLVIGNNDIVQSPEPKTNIIDVPGSSYRLDLTETLTGKTEYSGRTLTFSFGIRTSREKWPAVCKEVMLLFHGQKVQVILDTEPDYVYEGRATVTGFDRVGALGTFTMTVDADAYKYDVNSSIGDWLWDPFNFETGVIRKYGSIAVDGTATLEIPGSDIPMTPTFVITDFQQPQEAYLMYNGTRYALAEGKKRFASLVIPTTGGEITFYGHYTVSVDVRGGSL